MDLIDSLIQEGWLKTPRIIGAFQTIKRIDFMPKGMENLAELNEALPIGYSQTISQPLTVAFMFELLQPKPGDKILDIGSGSGWTTALLAEIVSQQGGTQNSIRRLADKTQNYNLKLKTGKVIGIEILPELKDFGENNVSKYNFIKKGIVEFICTDGSKGHEKEAPYDKILVSATTQREIPRAWKEQLKVGGRIVTPIGSSIWLFIKKSQDKFEEYENPGFIFVPLISGKTG